MNPEKVTALSEKTCETSLKSSQQTVDKLKRQPPSNYPRRLLKYAVPLEDDLLPLLGQEPAPKRPQPIPERAGMGWAMTMGWRPRLHGRCQTRRVAPVAAAAAATA